MGLLYDLLFFYGIYIIESYVGNRIMLLPRYGVNLGWGVTLALASDFEGHQNYLELFSSSLRLTHSWNSSLILTFSDRSLVLQLS